MNKIWKLKPWLEVDAVQNLSRAINVNQTISALLIQRGINNFQQAEAFFNPNLSHLHNPFLMADMRKAVERLLTALETHEKVLIYGDYDVDGTTSVALVYDFLHRYGGFYPENLQYYIPDRYTEGYGISKQGIDYAHENGFTLIISLDCGIKSADKVAYAAQMGIDFIVCDHHTVGNTLPQAIAVLDPKRPDCTYPYKELSGCGVGFKFMQAYSESRNLPIEHLYEYLDLLAVSIAADIVPMTGENRVFCYYGLKKINEQPRPGIKALIGITGFKKELSIHNVVFGLAPRINAAGRISHAHSAVQLLLAEKAQEAEHHAQILQEHNTERKDLDSSITAEALQMIESEADYKNLFSTVLFNAQWSKGVVGIVASRCTEVYYRPTIILTESHGKAAGSARSVDGFDVYEAISQCADVLEQFGGHTYAAGLTLSIENIPLFKQRFEQAVKNSILPEQLVPKVDIDAEVDIDFINERVYKIIQRMQPFGPGNMTPVFMISQVKAENIRIMAEKHLRFTAVKNNKKINCIMWNAAEHTMKIASDTFDIAFTIEANTFNHRTTLELMVREVRFAST